MEMAMAGINGSAYPAVEESTPHDEHQDKGLDQLLLITSCNKAKRCRVTLCACLYLAGGRQFAGIVVRGRAPLTSQMEFQWYYLLIWKMIQLIKLSYVRLPLLEL